jgi:hypothetical protein
VPAPEFAAGDQARTYLAERLPPGSVHVAKESYLPPIQPASP